MLLLFEILAVAVVPSICLQKHQHFKPALPPLIPDETFKDVFLPGSSGLPTYGKMSTTCWARGGLCMDMRDCPEREGDYNVAGCSWGHKVCCRVFKFGSPTVGLNRKQGWYLNRELSERRFWKIAMWNSERLL